MFKSLENFKNGLKYTIVSRELKHNKHGKCYKYIIELKHNNKKRLFSFCDSVYSYEHGMAFDILDAVYCFLADMQAYDNTANLQDFAWYYGYNMDDIENINNTRKIYNACHDNSNKMHDLFTKKELNMLDDLFQKC